MFSILIALLAGAMLPLQAVFNARLGRVLGAPIWAAAVSGAVTTITLVVIGVVVMRTPPRIEDAAELPWWAWAGGFRGVLALAGMTAATLRLGAATMIAAVVCAQVVPSILLDRIGMFGIPPTRSHATAYACRSSPAEGRSSHLLKKELT
jgi:transporter family-2 protein